jgi:hypothetical protein
MAAGLGTDQLKHGELYRTGALQQGFPYVFWRPAPPGFRSAQSTLRARHSRTVFDAVCEGNSVEIPLCGRNLKAGAFRWLAGRGIIS